MDEDASDEFTVCQFAAFPSISLGHVFSWTASQLPSGVLADVPRLLARQVGPVTSEILETFLGQQPLTPLCWVGGGLFLTRLGHRPATGHTPHFKLKFSLALSIGTHGGGLIYFGVCFDQKFIFLVHFLSQSGENM